MKDKVILIVKGFCMGAADVVPGVSGGTMAFILGIYQQLIEAIKSFDLLWIKSLLKLDFKHFISRPHLSFLVPLGIGILCALLFFTRVISLPTLIHTHPEAIYSLFFGLISGSVVVLLAHGKLLKIQNVMAIVLGLIGGLIIFNLVPTQTPETSWFIFFCGALAICAMILPGISGSFILLILNKYAYIFNAIGYFKLSILIPFGLGAVTGLLLFSRVLSFFLNKYYQFTLMMITGILVASLWVIWPFQDRQYADIGGKQYLIHSTPIFPGEITSSLLVPVVLALFGMVLVLMVNFIAGNKVRIGG